LVGKPTILVPSPHVAEDHQTHNARSLSERGGAILMPDTDVVADLGSKLDELFKDESARKDMAANMKGAARPEAAQAVVDQVELLIARS
jgi:UDP-N-acetylglucosamine--N-acetylmuramyl-(pentapeptide) pyrophosphoryl-undecaprenol N-acetylglucosamine transferase